MSKDKKNGRPVSNNVDYFPHKCKDDKELVFIYHKYKSKGYEVFYRLQQCLDDAEFHRIDLGNGSNHLINIINCIIIKLLI